MRLISYAAHFEDLMLWRALRQIEHGQYLDVGAGDPLAGSATQLFYERGWHGINLEPAYTPLRQLRIARPADINLQLAAAAAEGTADFYEVPNTPLSTLDAAQAEAYRAHGQDVVLRQAALRTLDQVCAEHLQGPLHFVHLGMADPAAALAGFDLQRWQPWLVVLRAHAGATQPALQAAGYTLAYQDGWKQYYVAPQQAALAAALQLPPNPDDGYILAEGHPHSFPLTAWQQRTAAAEAEAATSRTWAQAHVAEWKHKYGQLEQQRARADELARELNQVRGMVEEQAGRLEHDRQHYLEQRAIMDQRLVNEQALVQAVEAREAALLASLSWRITRPLRQGSLMLSSAPGWLRRLPRRLVNGVLRRIKRLLGAMVRYVIARPRLSFFLRRALMRVPFLRALAIKLYLRAKTAPAEEVALPPDLNQLPDAARRMFADLRRAAPHS
ncbi:hypothetical protein GTP58_18075 [Duganella sp. CY15W]|uniref:FkbM family methyltransferase n=1 Tax=Duganella sp. CY15W TaxID=2692172 RepID=UPI00136B19F3|nr:FkbM family methyltransferase [Duganella sp. CY15W]MYM30242.1 hypothetical protein [Duganella sp. CY15W]